MGCVGQPHAAGRARPVHLGPIYADDLWLHLGGVQIQPAELAKLALVAVGRRPAGPQGHTVAVVAGAVQCRCSRSPVVLLLLVGYNDLGSMICLVVLFTGLLWAAGARLRVFGWLGRGRAGRRRRADPAAGGKDYRLARLKVFFDPTIDPNAEDGRYQYLRGPLGDRQRRLVRRRARRGAPQVGPAAQRAQRLHLRHRRRGARRRRLPRRAAALRRAHLHRAAHRPPGRGPVPPARRGRRSPSGSSGRRSSTSAASSASCRSPACPCRSSPTAAAPWSWPSPRPGCSASLRPAPSRTRPEPCTPVRRDEWVRLLWAPLPPLPRARSGATGVHAEGARCHGGPGGRKEP